MSSNRFPLIAIFNFGNIQKSQGAMSGLYGGWRSCAILCFAKNCCTRFDECAGVLSWWRSQSPLNLKRGRWLDMAPTLTCFFRQWLVWTLPLWRLLFSFTKAFCIISLVFVQLLPRLKQNLMQIRWSVLSVIFNCKQMRRTEKAPWTQTHAARDPSHPVGNYGIQRVREGLLVRLIPRRAQSSALAPKKNAGRIIFGHTSHVREVITPKFG